MRRSLRISASLWAPAPASKRARWRATSAVSRPSSPRTCSHERPPAVGGAASGGTAGFPADAPGAGECLGIAAVGPLSQILDVPRVGERDVIDVPPSGPVDFLGARDQNDGRPALIEGEQEPWLACAARTRAEFPEVAQ